MTLVVKLFLILDYLGLLCHILNPGFVLLDGVTGGVPLRQIHPGATDDANQTVRNDSCLHVDLPECSIGVDTAPSSIRGGVRKAR